MFIRGAHTQMVVCAPNIETNHEIILFQQMPKIPEFFVSQTQPFEMAIYPAQINT